MEIYFIQLEFYSFRIACIHNRLLYARILIIIVIPIKHSMNCVNMNGWTCCLTPIKTFNLTSIETKKKEWQTSNLLVTRFFLFSFINAYSIQSGMFLITWKKKPTTVFFIYLFTCLIQTMCFFFVIVLLTKYVIRTTYYIYKSYKEFNYLHFFTSIFR